jgi:hypothetical protein
VWLWERESRRLVGRYKGHSDFVKSIVCARLSGKDVRTYIFDKTPLCLEQVLTLCVRS